MTQVKLRSIVRPCPADVSLNAEIVVHASGQLEKATPVSAYELIGKIL
jgi:hypothetical protein